MALTEQSERIEFTYIDTSFLPPQPNQECGKRKRSTGWQNQNPYLDSKERGNHQEKAAPLAQPGEKKRAETAAIMDWVGEARKLRGDLEGTLVSRRVLSRWRRYFFLFSRGWGYIHLGWADERKVGLGRPEFNLSKSIIWHWTGFLFHFLFLFGEILPVTEQWAPAAAQSSPKIKKESSSNTPTQVTNKSRLQKAAATQGRTFYFRWKRWSILSSAVKRWRFGDNVIPPITRTSFSSMDRTARAVETNSSIWRLALSWVTSLQLIGLSEHLMSRNTAQFCGCQAKQHIAQYIFEPVTSEWHKSMKEN